MPHLISDTHSGVCWLLCPPSHVLIYFVLLLSAQADKGLSESLFLALVAAVLRVYHRAGWTEGSAMIKWNADHLSTVSHNPTAYLTSLPSGVLNSGCIGDKRNTDDNPKFHHRAHRPWQQRRLHHCRKALEITVTYRPRLSCFHWFGKKSTGCISESVKGNIMHNANPNDIPNPFFHRT